MTETVAQTTPSPKAFFAQLAGAHGVLVKPGAEVIFLDSTTQAVTPITPDNALQVIVLRNVAEALADVYADQQAGYAGVRHVVQA